METKLAVQDNVVVIVDDYHEFDSIKVHFESFGLDLNFTEVGYGYTEETGQEGYHAIFHAGKVDQDQFDRLENALIN